ncbi:uncharacterized protein LOC104901533 [Beta vulgaris subsp. vulgaris]|uniref:uncharacterized protein LOC104901533 n=1 Tax=Beta vulgaris subsp. vulgaris TaxID=3555 RepID=UPI00053F839C|nr:uncharacterized protein LOC104901533 [Beta vulgaris subsp. vulgaris]
MTSVIRRRDQFEDKIASLKTNISDLEAKVTSTEGEVTKLNEELKSQKETFQEASAAVKAHTTLKDNHKRLQEDLDKALIDRNASQKRAEELQTKLADAVEKYNSSRHKLKKAEVDLKQAQGEWLAHWKTTPEGLDYLGKLASTSYRLATRETKQRLHAILPESNASLDWAAVKAEFDRHIAAEQEAKAQAKKKVESSQTPGASEVQEVVSSSTTPIAQPTSAAPTTQVPVEGDDDECCSSVEVSSEEDASVDSSPEKAAEA